MKRKTQEQFIQEATEIHTEFYTYENTKYKNINTKVTITCPIHKDFLQTPRAHLVLKQGCPKCVPAKLKQKGRERAKTTEQFIQGATNIHGNKYDYSLVKYTTTHNKVIIICSLHGKFNQTPNQHVSAKRGCPTCGNRRAAGIGGYTLERLQTNKELASRIAALYVVEFVGEKEHFYKIGITCNTPEHRFYTSNKKGMKVTILQQHYMSLLEAFTIEQNLLETLKEYQYWPNKRIGGFTECFKPIQQVLTIINEERIN